MAGAGLPEDCRSSTLTRCGSLRTGKKEEAIDSSGALQDLDANNCNPLQFRPEAVKFRKVTFAPVPIRVSSVDSLRHA